MKRITAVAALLLACSLVAASCTIGGPAPTTWKVRPVSITVVDDEDNDGGDEPYVIQIGFRSKLGVPHSSATQIASQCWNQAVPPMNAGSNGTTLTVPPGAADITFPATQNLDVGDVLLGTAPFEIFGTLTFVMERDGLFAGCAVSDLLDNALVGVMKDALDLLIAGSDVPPTQEQLVNLILSHLGDFLNAVGSYIGAIIEGLGNPDDIMGVGVQILLPTAGAFTDLFNTALAIGGIFQPGLEKGFIPVDDLPSSVKIRVGPLVGSTTTFDFPSEVGHYIYTSQISH
jgi:hypothetical protein